MSSDQTKAQDLLLFAIITVLKEKRCSSTMICHRLNISYELAVKLTEAMEKIGLVSEPNYIGKRSVATLDVDVSYKAESLSCDEDICQNQLEEEEEITIENEYEFGYEIQGPLSIDFNITNFGNKSAETSDSQIEFHNID